MRQLGSGLALVDPVPLLNPGAGADPLVGGIHERGQLIVGDDPVGHGEAGPEKASAQSCYLGPDKSVRKDSSYHLDGLSFTSSSSLASRGAAHGQSPDPASQAAVSGQPMLRQVSQTTPMGVSQPGHQSSGGAGGARRCWTASKPPR